MAHAMGLKSQELEASRSILLELHDKDLPPLKTILLLLDPADLKAVRQTCKSLNEYIKREVWGSSGGKAQLTEKLLTRWSNDEATPVELTRLESSVRNILCNERFVFCSLRNGLVSVHDIASGDLVTHLRPGPADSAKQRRGLVGINKGLVASLSPLNCGVEMGGTVWSVPQMEVVTHVSFVLPNSCQGGEDGEGTDEAGLGVDCRWSNFGVCPVSATKVVVALKCLDHENYSLVVADKTFKGEWVWHHLLRNCRSLAYDCEDGYIAGTTGHNKVSIWNKTNQVNIGLPDLGEWIQGLILRRPFLVLSTSVRINVYKVETGAHEGTLLKSITCYSPPLSLIQRLRLSRSRRYNPVQSNQHLFVLRSEVRGCIRIVRMDSLLDESKKTAEEVEVSQITLPDFSERDCIICMNTTTLLFKSRNGVSKKDFWVGQDRPQS